MILSRRSVSLRRLLHIQYTAHCLYEYSLASGSLHEIVFANQSGPRASRHVILCHVTRCSPSSANSVCNRYAPAELNYHRSSRSLIMASGVFEFLSTFVIYSRLSSRPSSLWNWKFAVTDFLSTRLPLYEALCLQRTLSKNPCVRPPRTVS
jgi:hypothetical protein